MATTRRVRAARRDAGPLTGTTAGTTTEVIVYIGLGTLLIIIILILIFA
jgi:hypothetical protein